jgi:polyisoprenoid-binding protein YceI
VRLIYLALIAAAQFFLATTSFAIAQSWKIVPENSSIVFKATQNGAPVTGSFGKFSGSINFDPAQLNDSKVDIVIDMNSISTSYSDLTDTLKTAEWFNVKVFPQASFNACKFTKTGDNQYQADGTLTIRDKSQPVKLTFTLTITGEKAEAVGNTTLTRTAFGVGQGEWSSLDEIKDEVMINFRVNAVK